MLVSKGAQKSEQEFVAQFTTFQDYSVTLTSVGRGDVFRFFSNLVMTKLSKCKQSVVKFSSENFLPDLKFLTRDFVE